MRPRTIALTAAALFGCGTKASPTKPPPEVNVVSGEPTAASASMVESLDAAGPIALIGSTSQKHVLAVMSGEVYEVESNTLVHRSLYAQSGEPTSTGTINAIAPRSAGGAWIAADQGVFLLDTLYVTKASFTTGMGPVRSASEVPTGPLAGLWIAGDDGLFMRNGSNLTAYAISGVSGRIDAIAVESTGTSALVLAGGEAILLESDGTTIKSDRPPLEAGTINAVAAGTGVLYAASDSGVLRYRPAASPKWTRFTLAASGMPALKVRSLAVDPGTGAVWMHTESGLARLTADAAEILDAQGAGDISVAAIAIDEIGDLWAAGAMKLAHLGTGSGMAQAVTFANDISPWLGMHCTQCHGNQTQNFQDYTVFAPLAEMALERVRSGDMPRCDGGQPCPSDKHLQETDYAILEQWVRVGKPK